VMKYWIVAASSHHRVRSRIERRKPFSWFGHCRKKSGIGQLAVVGKPGCCKKVAGSFF
jgi:hypothetical protein